LASFCWCLSLVAGLGAALVATVPTLLWGEFADHSQVVSIRGVPEYQDPALLEKAWSLPVARLYRRSLHSQRNASFCGPASIANVLRSLDRSADQSTVLQGTTVSTVLGFLPAVSRSTSSPRSPR
jgi:hypothetical protein